MSKEEAATTSKFGGFLDKGTEMVGDISFKDSFRIDGKFKGKVLSGQMLSVGENGDVEADIKVDTISINGKVKGSIDASSRVEIFSKGRVIGQIKVPKLVIEEGAFFQGSCQMELKALEDKKKKPEIEMEPKPFK